jgi:hypothetical protein
VNLVMPGARVFYLGEGWGGCTGCDLMHETLAEHFDELAFIGMPNFQMGNNRFQIYERRQPS